MSEQQATAVVAEPGVRAKFFILLAPDVGATSMMSYDEPGDFAKAMHKWLTAKAAGAFIGEIVPFSGWLVDYTNPLHSFRLNVPNVGEIEIADSTRGKYVCARQEAAIESLPAAGAGTGQNAAG